jgi:hypothetical protein
LACFLLCFFLPDFHEHLILLVADDLVDIGVNVDVEGGLLPEMVEWFQCTKTVLHIDNEVLGILLLPEVDGTTVPLPFQTETHLQDMSVDFAELGKEGMLEQFVGDLWRLRQAYCEERQVGV